MKGDWLPNYGKDIGPIFYWVRLFDERNHQLVFNTDFAVKEILLNVNGVS